VNGANIDAQPSIVDAQGNTWTIVAGVIEKNGVHAGNNYNVNRDGAIGVQSGHLRDPDGDRCGHCPGILHDVPSIRPLHQRRRHVPLTSTTEAGGDGTADHARPCARGIEQPAGASCSRSMGLLAS
jgi:hypothetical protein